MKDIGVWFVDDAMVERGYRKYIAGAAGQVEIIHAAELERVGGPCPICGLPFAPLDVDNAYGKFRYYVPACRCFPKCPKCNRWLVEETLLNVTGCTNCRPKEYGVQPLVRRGKSRRREEVRA